MICHCFEVTKTKAAIATVLPLKAVVEIARKHTPGNEFATVKAIWEALAAVRREIDQIEGSEA